MGGMNSRLRISAYELCKDRDGEKCNICNEPGTPLTLIVDHLDNNDKNNPKDGSNWQLLCRRHNYIKNPRRKKSIRIHTSLMRSDTRDQSTAEMQKNAQAEPMFRHWIVEQIRHSKDKRIRKDEAINGGAEYASCSPETIRKRYLPKMLSSVGMLFIYDDASVGETFITLKPKHWVGVMPEDNGFLDLIGKEYGE